MKSRRLSLAVGSLIGVCCCCMLVFIGLLASGRLHAAPAFDGVVMAVADGDTLTVLSLDRPLRVRLAEIDAPEKKQAFGAQSANALYALCIGKRAVVSSGKTDRYGRTVARVECAGVDASLYQVKRGLAWAYTAYMKDDAIFVAETEARDLGLGLWADPVRIPPWEYRRGKR